MDRYNKITNKNNREIVLLRSFPCIWGKCSFCDYIDDNGRDEDELNNLNKEVLDNITGEFGVLEVINSGSCFEIPKETMSYIKKIVDEKKIKLLFFESHWCYRNRLDEIKNFFNVPIVFKIGVELLTTILEIIFLIKMLSLKILKRLLKSSNLYV